MNDAAIQKWICAWAAASTRRLKRRGRNVVALGLFAGLDAADAAHGLGLPPLVRDPQIDFTALSFVAVERVRFRYKLEGYDNDWQEVGNRRQAFYTNLAPRHYRFRVRPAGQ